MLGERNLAAVGAATHRAIRWIWITATALFLGGAILMWILSFMEGC